MRIQAFACKPNDGINLENLPEYVTQTVLLARFGINRMRMKRILGRFARYGTFDRKVGSGAAASVMTVENKANALRVLEEEK